MIAYHGTTARRARRICVEGFLPRKPSRRVWFAESKAYAEGRARTQARRAHDRPAVLTCNIDLHQIRARLGAKRVFRRGGCFAVDGPVPATILRSFPGQDAPTTPEQMAAWVNHVLGLKPHKGVGRRHPGVDRLSRWAVRRLTHQPDSHIESAELLHMARQWLPEYFEGVEIDPETLHLRRRLQTIELEVEPPGPEIDPREEEALECLEAANPRRRARGLAILAEIADPDLFDWCVMFIDDASAEMRLAALQGIIRCRDGDPEVLLPFSDSEDNRIRAAAIAALAKHSGKDAPRWFERGLKDPSPHVRRQMAALLPDLDPTENRSVFELALHDPNPDVAHMAEKLTAGKGYARHTFRHDIH